MPVFQQAAKHANTPPKQAPDFRPISGLFRLIRHWLFNRRDGDGGDEGLIAVQLGEAFGQGAHGGQLVFAELVGQGSARGAVFGFDKAGGWMRMGLDGCV